MNKSSDHLQQHLWHRRLAHVDPSAIKYMSKNDIVTGIDLTNSGFTFNTCDGCIMGKGHRTPIPRRSKSSTTRLLELIHSDVNSPMEVASIGGSRYFVSFVDDYSKWTVVYSMKAKSQTFEIFKKFHTYAEKHTGAKVKSISMGQNSSDIAEKIKKLRTDNGGEYISTEFKQYLEKHGIQHQLTIQYTPQQNGVSERMNRTLMNLVRSMLHAADLNKGFWAEALGTAAYIRNRVTSRSLPSGVTPYHRWMN